MTMTFLNSSVTFVLEVESVIEHSGGHMLSQIFSDIMSIIDVPI